MGSVTKIKGKYGDTYRAQAYVKGKRPSETFDTKSEARRWLEQTEHLLRTGQPLPGELPDDDMDFLEAAEKYATSVSLTKKKNSQRLDQECINRLEKRFKGKTLKTLTPQDIADYRDYRLRTVGPSTIIQDMSFIAQLYETARLEWVLPVENPEKNIKRPPPPANRKILLTIEEINILLDACKKSRNSHLYSYVLLMLQTAMRPSEGAGLKWKNVLLDAHVLDLTETKTDPRRVPLTSLAHSHLVEVKKNRDKNNPWVFLPEATSDSRVDLSKFFRKSFGNAVKRAKIQHVTLYGLRHSAASYLLINGVDIRFVAEIMGHRRLDQTRQYTHFLDEHKIKQVSALEGIINQ